MVREPPCVYDSLRGVVAIATLVNGGDDTTPMPHGRHGVPLRIGCYYAVTVDTARMTENWHQPDEQIDRVTGLGSLLSSRESCSKRGKAGGKRANAGMLKRAFHRIIPRVRRTLTGAEGQLLIVPRLDGSKAAPLTASHPGAHTTRTPVHNSIKNG